jgi:hypothetical protein
MPTTDDRLRETLAAQGPGKWAEIAGSADYTEEAQALARELLSTAPTPAVSAPAMGVASPASGTREERPPSIWVRGGFALAFLAMGGYLLGSFLSSSQVPFWYESCLVLGLGAALLCLALFAWVRAMWVAHLVSLCLAVGTAGLVGSFLDSGRTSYVMPTVLAFLAVTAAWYLVLFLRRRK